MTVESLQFLIGLITVSGVGGIWFRLGAVISKQRSADERYQGFKSDVEKRFERIERKLEALKC